MPVGFLQRPLFSRSVGFDPGIAQLLVDLDHFIHQYAEAQVLLHLAARALQRHRRNPARDGLDVDSAHQNPTEAVSRMFRVGTAVVGFVAFAVGLVQTAAAKVAECRELVSDSLALRDEHFNVS